MACSSCSTEIQPYGAKPAVVQWNAVRGDTASLRIEFWEDDEVTPIDTSGWQYKSTAYLSKSGVSYDLVTTPNSNYVDISALPTMTDDWGLGATGSVVAELSFDLEITKTDNTVWTPVVGTICVLGDITFGGSL